MVNLKNILKYLKDKLTDKQHWEKERIAEEKYCSRYLVTKERHI